MLVTMPIALVFSLLFVLLIRFTGGFFVYLFILTSLLIFIGTGVYMLVPEDTANPSLPIKSYRLASVALGIISLIISFFIVCWYCCYRKRVNLAASIVRVSAQFVHQNCSIFILSLILLALLFLLVLLWIFLGICFHSMATFIGNDKGSQLYPFKHY